MKSPIAVALAACLLLVAFVPTEGRAGYPTQFLGVCQRCGCDIIACYRLVECLDGGCEYQWVTERHDHCRPAYKGRRKFDLLRSPLVNPGAKKRPPHRWGREIPRPSCCPK